MEKYFGLIVLVLSSVTNLTENVTRFHELIWKALWGYKIISVTTDSFQRPIVLEKNHLPIEKEPFGTFFLVLSSITNTQEQIIRVHKVFWQFLWKW